MHCTQQRAGMKSAHDSMPPVAYEFQISCSRLPRSNAMEWDPICIMQRRGEGEFDAGWQEVFRTERLMNTNNPRFQRIARINYIKVIHSCVSCACVCVYIYIYM